MLEVIVAVNNYYGIGYDGYIPWKNKEELKHFKKLTMGATLIVGRKTYERLPVLEGRTIICLTNNLDFQDEKCIVFHDIEQVYEYMKKDTEMRYIVAGGSDIYKLFMSDKRNNIKVHISIVNNTNECDTYFDENLLNDFTIISENTYETFKYRVLERTKHDELGYLDISKKLIAHGSERRGRNGITYSLFNEHMKFDLRKGFPLLTTKKMFFRGIVEELLFFLRGDTDTTILSDKNVNIWRGNTTAEFLKGRNLDYAPGVMGPMYGYQWRHYNNPYKLDKHNKPLSSSGGIDQLYNVIELIKNDPFSRRILMTTYNPCQSDEGVLYPCHSLMTQFYVDEEYLDMFCYNRSQDFFLGTPYNIASSALLLIIVSKLTNKIPRYMNITMGDVHLYESHIEQVKTQSARLPYTFPELEVSNINKISDIYKLKYEDFILNLYKSHPIIRADMVT